MADRHKVFIDLTQDQWDHFWVPSEGDKFNVDVADWRAMDPRVKWRIKMCVHLLSHMDVEIIQNLSSITDHVKDEGIRMCIDAQRNMENVHTLAYEMVDKQLEHPLAHADLDEIRLKVEHLSSFTNGSMATQIVAQALAEGVSFVSLFPIFYYLRKKGLLPETCTVNDEVLRDENLHTRMYITMYDVLTKDGTMSRLSQDEVHDLVSSFVETEDRIASYIYGGQDEEEKAFFTVMSPENSMTYTRMVANSVTRALGYDPLYPDAMGVNPFPFVNQSVMDTLVGFFDRESAEYGIRTDHHYDSDSDPE